MGGQVLGGGVIVLVAVVLWLVYLLPSWHSRRQYDAAERNAVRLNQALRVLAETSETPQEVRLELNARTASAQQKLARRALAEREHAALEASRIELARARDERAAAEEQAKIDEERHRVERVLDQERARADKLAVAERARAERAALALRPEVRRAAARRRVRLVSVVVVLAGLAAAGFGAWEVVATGSQVFVWVGGAVTGLALLTLHRMSRVAARAASRVVVEVPERVAGPVQDVALDTAERGWSPRELPRPLTASAGSRAAAVLDAEEAHEALRQAALEETMRRRAEAARPPSIDTARTARRTFADDAEIEAHVRDLLARRAAGQ